jgi:predicted PurR-regulated permease PerM
MVKTQKNKLIYSILALALFAFALSFLPFAATIIVAAIFALGISFWLDNVYINFSKKKRKVVMSAICLGLLLLVGTTFNASGRLYDLTMGSDREQTMSALNEAKKSVLAQVESSRGSLEKIGINLPPIKEEKLIKDWSNFAQSSVMSSLTKAGDFLDTFTDILVNVLVFVVFVTIMVRRRRQILEVLSDTSLWGDLRLKKIYCKAQESGYGSVFTIFCVGLVQTIVMTLGATAAGFKEWSIIFTATFFASFFPVLGTAPVGVLLSAIRFFQGDNQGGLIMLFIAAFVGIVDNWLKPFLVTHSGPRMNGFIALVGIVGAVMIFGLPGLFVGPFLMIFIPNLKTEAADLLRSLTRSRAQTTDTAPHEPPQYQSSQFN